MTLFALYAVYTPYDVCRVPYIIHGKSTRYLCVILQYNVHAAHFVALATSLSLLI